jgi:spore maturation protein CgeB
LHEQEKTIAASFVGQPHGNRRSVVRYLERNGIEVATYGNGWPNGRISQEEMIRIFNISKINLNLSNSSWNLRTIFRNQQQIKGRNFEIPGCGGFILTNYVEGIERYFVLDKEIVCFSDRRDLLEKVRYYLAHDEERSRIAQAGYERTLRDHTYEIRFRELFTQMGFVL